MEQSNAKSLIVVTDDPTNPTRKIFTFCNGLNMGTAERDVDGCYYFFDNCVAKGFQGEEVLYAIADEIRLLNRDWDRVMGRDPAIGGSPDYEPPPTLKEATASCAMMASVMKEAASHPELRNSLRKMEGLTQRHLYPWLRPVYDTLQALLKAVGKD